MFCNLKGTIFEKFSVRVVPPERRSGWRSVKCCSQLLHSPVSRAVTPSYRGNISLRGFVHVCVLVCAPVWTFCCARLVKRACKVCILLKHFTFLMSRCHANGRSDSEWRHGNRLLTAYLANTQARCCGGGVCHSSRCVCVCVCVCWLRFVWGRSSPPLCCLPPHSLCSGEELQSCDIRVSLGTHSFSSPPTLHSSSAWHSEVNYHDLHRS